MAVPKRTVLAKITIMDPTRFPLLKVRMKGRETMPDLIFRQFRIKFSPALRADPRRMK